MKEKEGLGVCDVFWFCYREWLGGVAIDTYIKKREKNICTIISLKKIFVRLLVIIFVSIFFALLVGKK